MADAIDWEQLAQKLGTLKADGESCGCRSVGAVFGRCLFVVAV